MVTPHTGGTATLLRDGKLLVAGGSAAAGPLAAAELYDPATGSWSATGTMSTPRTGHTATLLPDGKVLVAGGEATVPRGLNEPPSLASAELYDPATGSWTATGSMTTSRSGQSATLLRDGKVLVAGGQRLHASHAGLRRAVRPDDRNLDRNGFHGHLASWSGGHAPPRRPRTGSGRQHLDPNADGTSGGWDLSSAELYDPTTGSWTSTGSMTGTAGGLTIVLLPNGKVLHVGVPAELFDPANGSWATTGNMLTPRGGEGVTLLLDGKVLVEGGAGGGSVGIGSAELYDPASGSWAATASPGWGSQSATATLLLDGRALVAGGGADGRSAELYDPGSGRWTAVGWPASRS